MSHFPFFERDMDRHAPLHAIGREHARAYLRAIPEMTTDATQANVKEGMTRREGLGRMRVSACLGVTLHMSKRDAVCD